MNTENVSGSGVRSKQSKASAENEISLEHYLRLVLHRKWLVLGVFVAVTIATIIIAQALPNIYTADTVILVDPQKVPETYVKPTVTGDVRGRLGTLSQQILSATRLQKIIDTFNLYPEDRKKMAREEVIGKMRSNISVSVVSDYGGSQDLQAFKITYSGKDPRLVAQVTNELASLFIEENLKAREQQATGTTEFLSNQLSATRKTLEEQEQKLRDFKLKHIGEMPEQQAADLQILGQMQAQLQAESDALNRAEQQKTYIQSMMAQSSPVVDLDTSESKTIDNTPEKASAGAPRQTTLGALQSRLASMQTRYTDKHPEIQKLKREIAEEEAREAAVPQTATVTAKPPAPSAPKQPTPARTAGATYVNPVLQSQIAAVDAEIAKHKQERERLSKLAASYQSKLEAIPIREQEITDLARDYEMSKAHYAQLLEKQLSAETATQLEIRQKGERFSILDPAQQPEKPSSPNRMLIDLAGSFGGLGLGLILALCTEFLGSSITTPEQVRDAIGIPVLEVIPIIQTRNDRARRKRQLIWATLSGVVATIVLCGAVLLYRYRT